MDRLLRGLVNRASYSRNLNEYALDLISTSSGVRDDELDADSNLEDRAARFQLTKWRHSGLLKSSALLYVGY